MRIIPARAGFTKRLSHSNFHFQDHPRSRGVYATDTAILHTPPGSSPLARGLLNVESRRMRERRIIPARAGFTPVFALFGGVYSDHPRSRGVYRGNGQEIPADQGSSPLARGLPSLFHSRSACCGIIPARAGFTARLRPSRSRRSGSSPLARGLLVWCGCASLHAGIIPARAGFTRQVASATGHVPDHPRSRGVYVIVGLVHGPADGSSPLARGLQSYRLNADACGGIIPARAGFTAGRSLAQQASQDHPRSRGVYAGAIARIAPIVGSSPLARGLQQSATLTAVAAGIIPARAGFTSP